MNVLSSVFLSDKTAVISFAESLHGAKHPHPKNGAFDGGTPGGRERRVPGATSRCRHQLRSLVRRSTQSLSRTTRRGVGRTTQTAPSQDGQPIPEPRRCSTSTGLNVQLGSYLCLVCEEEG